MWNSNKSLVLSQICTKAVMVLVIICALGLPHIMDFYRSINNDMLYVDDSGVEVFCGILYACCVPALVALFSLNKMLSNIKREEVFIHKNVTYLRIISWCCFAVAGFAAVAGCYYLLFFFGAALAAFIGLILRVVKNVIDQAISIKAENDFTI